MESSHVSRAWEQKLARFDAEHNEQENLKFVDFEEEFEDLFLMKDDGFSFLSLFSSKGFSLWVRMCLEKIK